MAFEDKTSGQTFSASKDPYSSIDELFDDILTDNTGFLIGSPDPTEWVQVEFTTAWPIEKMRLRSWYNDAVNRSPDQIILKASNTGVFGGEETTIYDTGSGLSWSNSEWKEWEFENATSYKYYRQTWYRSGSTWLAMNECELMVDIGEQAGDGIDFSDEPSVTMTYAGNIAEGIGLNDLIDVDSPYREIDDSIGISDLINGSGEFILPAISENIGLMDFVDASIFPGRIIDEIGLSDYIAGAFEYLVEISDTIGLNDQIDALNWTQWLNLYGDRAIKRFLFTLTGEADSTTDIQIPISSFQARKRTGYDTYLSVSIPNFSLASQIEARSNGEMVLDMGYEIDGIIEIQQEFIRANLDRIDTHKGSKRRSIVLVGYKTQSFENQISIVENPIYKSTLGGSILYRFANLDPYVNPGDTCQVGSDEFTIDYITYTVSDRYSVMEIKEI